MRTIPRVSTGVIDIPKRPNLAYASYAGKDVAVKHLLSGDYRVFYAPECIAWVNKNNDRNEDAE